MNPKVTTSPVRCAIYTRKSHADGLDMEFNSLDQQRESGEAYIKSQAGEGWILVDECYEDAAISGATMERPALKRLLQDIEDGLIDVVVVYKIDRLSRSLRDFGKLMDVFDQHEVSFVSVTQRFDTSSSMGKLTLNILMSFAEFERQVIGERIRDKIAGHKKRGKYTGGRPPLGYTVDREKKRLTVIEEEAKLVRKIFKRFCEIESSTTLSRELNDEGYTTKTWITKKGKEQGGLRWNKSHIYRTLNNRLYLGQIEHKDQVYEGEHTAIVSQKLWDRAHKILEKNNRQRANRTRAKRTALLKGLLTCGHCERTMNATFSSKDGRRYSYYVCQTCTKNSYRDCPVKTIPAGELEDAVINQLRAVFQSPETIVQTFKEAQALEQNEINRLEAEIKALSKSKDEGGKLRLRQSKRLLRALKATPLTEQKVIENLKTLDPIWNELFPIEQARIVQSLVESITVFKDGLELKIQCERLRSLIAELQDEVA